MRKLKHHEQKLLKKVNFYDWKSDNATRVNALLRRYHITDKDDYDKYNKIVGQVTKLVAQMRKLKASDKDRIKMTEMLLSKLYNMGVINNKQSLEVVETLSASTFCRRRLPVVMQSLKMTQTVKDAAEKVEQGHVRIGPNLCKNPNLHITRDMEDHVTWAEGSKIKRHVESFRNAVDDFDLLHA